MSLFAKPAKAQGPETYPECGCDAVVAIAKSLSLGDWQNYTEEERAAIGRELSNFQRLANETAGGEVRFHPEAAEGIQRKCTARALEELADGMWRFSARDTVPDDWRSRVATYLKAWICDMSPVVLTKMAEMLAIAGCRSEARHALEAVLLFPAYAPKHFGDDEQSRKLAMDIVADAEEQLQRL
jgi:hypothetical protein